MQTITFDTYYMGANREEKQIIQSRNPDQSKTCCNPTSYGYWKLLQKFAVFV